MGASGADSAQLGDDAVGAIGFARADTGLFVDAATASLGFSRAEVAAITESMELLHGIPASDQSGLAETLGLILGFGPSNSSALAESALAAMGFTRSDGVGLQGTVLFVLGFQRQESQAVADAVLATLGFARADSPSLRAAAEAVLAAARREGASASVSVVGALGFPRADRPSILDGATAAFGFGRADTGTLSESVEAVRQSLLSDGPGLGETIAFILGFQRVDSPSLVSSVLSALGFARADGSALTELVALFVGAAGEDDAGLSESAMAAFGFRRADGPGIVDAATAALGFGRAEVGALSESVDLLRGQNNSDGSILAEVGSVILGFQRRESSNLAESALAALGFSRRDASSLRGTVAFVLGFGRADAPALKATVEAAVAASRLDGAGAAEAVVGTLGFPRTDRLGVLDAATAVFGLGRGDLGALAESVALVTGALGADRLAFAENGGVALGFLRRDSASLAESSLSALGLRRGDTTDLRGTVAVAVGLGRGDLINVAESGAARVVLGRGANAALKESVPVGANFPRSEVGSLLVSANTRQTRGFPESSLLTAFGRSAVDTGGSATIGLAASVAFTVRTSQTTILPAAPLPPQGPPTFVAPEADLSIAIRGMPDVVFVEEALTYVITVVNNGASGASDVVVVDSLGSGTRFEAATPSQGACTEASGTVRCSLGTVGDGASATVTITVTPLAATGGTAVLNTATVSSDVDDPGSANNAASIETPVTAHADLSVIQSASQDPATVGQTLTYTLTVANAGPSAATDVALSHTFPAGLTLESVDPTQGDCLSETGSVTCDLGDLESGSLAVVSVSFTPTESLGATTIASTAAVSSSVSDLDSTNDSSVHFTLVSIPLRADLSVNLIDTPDPVPIGTVLTYTISVANSGPENATLVELTDTLFAGLSFQSAGSSQGTCTESSGVVTCDLGTIDSGEIAVVTVSVVPDDSTGGTTVSNVAGVRGSETDPNVNDNLMAIETEVSASPLADLALDLADSPDPVVVEEALVYTADVRNTGPSIATGVILTASLPEGITAESAAASQGNCAAGPGEVICTLDPLDAGSTAQVSITLRPASDAGGTQISLAANVVSDVIDPNASNNSAAATTAILSSAEADLSLTGRSVADSAFVGESLIYILTVANDGPSTAEAVVLTNTLPQGVLFESAAASTGDCNVDGTTVVCDLGDIDAQIDATITVTVTAAAESGGSSITNVATVTSRVFDPDASNNEASQSAAVLPHADLSMIHENAAAFVPAGEEFIYTLAIANEGPSPAESVIVRDALPTGLTLVSAVASQGSCSQSALPVPCRLGTIASGSRASVTMKVRAEAEVGGFSVTGTATVESEVADLDEVNNVDSLITGVTKKADIAVSLDGPPNGALSGREFAYEITVANLGPSDASEVGLTDPVPEGLSLVSTQSSQGTCIEVDGTVVCEIGVIAAGAQVSVAVVVAAGLLASQGVVLPIANTVDVAAAEADPVLSNNTVVLVTEVHSDGDFDGIGDGIEAGAPNGGDSDGDGVSDESQDNVASLRNAVDQRYLTIKACSDTVLSAVQAIKLGAEGEQPDVKFPAGLIRFRADSSCPFVELLFTEETIVDSYWKYGPTRDNPSPHWYEFLFDGATGAEIGESSIKLHFVDGERGDDDLTVNGVIADDGAPSFAPAELAIAVTASSDLVHVGDLITYDIEVINGGPSDAHQVVVTSELPADVILVSADASQGECTTVSGRVSCELGTVTGDAGSSVVIAIRPTAEASKESLETIASVESNEDDSDTTDNSARALTFVEPTADISVIARDLSDPVAVFDELAYAITVTNDGPSQATGLVLENTLPANVTFGSAVPSQGSCIHLAGTVTCSLGALDSGASVSIAIVVSPTAAAGGTTIANTATVSANEIDPDPDNNSTIEATTVSPKAALSVTQSDTRDPVVVGEAFTVTVRVVNHGPLQATGVVLTDTVPSGLAVESVAQSQGSCVVSGGSVVCELGSINAGSGATVTLTVMPLAAASGKTLSNTVSVAGTEEDPDLADNTSVQGTAVRPTADLDIAIDVANDIVQVGGRVIHTVTVTNRGPQTATGVLAASELPIGVLLISATSSQGVCSKALTMVSCAVGTVEASDTATFTLQLSPAPGIGDFVHTASVAGTEHDGDETGNRAAVSTMVRPVVDVSVTATDVPDPLPPGDALTYIIKVGNTGPSSASDVVVKGSLPGDLDVESVVASRGTCNVEARVVSCALGTITAGSDETVTITSERSEIEAGKRIASIVSVTAAEEDLDPDNNTVSQWTLTGGAVAPVQPRPSPTAGPGTVTAPAEPDGASSNILVLLVSGLVIVTAGVVAALVLLASRREKPTAVAETGAVVAQPVESKEERRNRLRRERRAIHDAVLARRREDYASRQGATTNGAAVEEARLAEPEAPAETPRERHNRLRRENRAKKKSELIRRRRMYAESTLAKGAEPEVEDEPEAAQPELTQAETPQVLELVAIGRVRNIEEERENQTATTRVLRSEDISGRREDSGNGRLPYRAGLSPRARLWTLGVDR